MAIEPITCAHCGTKIAEQLDANTYEIRYAGRAAIVRTIERIRCKCGRWTNVLDDNEDRKPAA